MAQEDQNRLTQQATRQSMGFQREQQMRAQQAHQAAQAQNYAKSITPLIESVNSLPETQKQQAYEAVLPQIDEVARQHGMDTKNISGQWDQTKADALLSQYGKKKPELFSKIDPSKYTPKSIRAFGKSRDYGDLVAIDDPDTVINNNLGDQNELAKALAREAGKDFIARRKDATDAKHSLQSSNKAIDLLNSGVITGTGANFIVGAGKALQRIGVNFAEDAVANTEAFYANQAKQVAQIIKAFGSGTGLSDADRIYAEKAAAGKITMSEQSIRRIIDMNQRASKNVITEFNADVNKLPAGTTPYDLTIEMPEVKSSLQAIPEPKTDEDYNKLPSGSVYIDPEDGKQYRKP